MSHSIAELRLDSPMWYFERNYFALRDILDALDLNEGSIDIELDGDRITITLVEQTRYTMLINIEHRFSRLAQVIPALRFEVRMYMDVRLAEVTSYQGISHLRPKYPYPNQGMHYPDEKRQTNLMLFDWLCACSRLDFRMAINNSMK